MNKQRLFGLIAAGIAFLGVLFPWASGIPVVEVATGTSFWWGWLMVALLGFAIIQLLAGDDKLPPGKLSFLSSLAAGLGGITVGIIQIVTLLSRIRALAADGAYCPGYAGNFHIGWGIYMLIGGCVMLILVTIFMRPMEANVTSSTT